VTDAIRYRFARGPGGLVEIAGLSIPMAGEHVVARGYGPTRAAALLSACSKIDDLLIGELALCDPRIEVGADVGAKVADLEARYGSKIREYGAAVRSGIEAGKALADSGASSDEVLNGIASGLATAGAILAAIPGVGWIAGAVVEIGAAILAGINALLKAYPARALDPYQAGINFALRELGYSRATGDPFALDSDAMMAAARDGWVFVSQQQTDGESWGTLVKRWPIAVANLLCQSQPDEARGISAKSMKARRDCIAQLEAGLPLEPPAAPSSGPAKMTRSRMPATSINSFNVPL